MKNSLMAGFALMIGCAAFALLPAQEPPTVQPRAQVTTQSKQVITISKVVTGAPFSGVEVTTTTQTLGDGSRIVHTNQRNLYRDSQGRLRSETQSTVMVLGVERPVANIVISDPAAGVTYTINTAARTARRAERVNFALTNLGSVLVVSAPGATSEKEQLPAAVVEGLYAEGTRSTTTIPAGQIGNERDIKVLSESWYSPDLRMDVLTKHSDPRSGETIYRLTNIRRTEPDPALFQVPAGYTVTDPSSRDPVPSKGNAVTK